MSLERSGRTMAACGILLMLASLGAPAGQAQSGFMAQFTLVTGNEWWQQAQVTPSGGTVARVDVRIDGGAWNPLKLQSWGVREWAGSYHAVDGSKVQFRAVSTQGNEWLSSCYQWIPPQTGGSTAQVVDCSSAPPPPPGAFDATFTGVRGNEWWVQASIATNGPAIAAVHVSLNGGSWMPVARQSWGWGSSYHIVQGTMVQLRATASDGQTDLSSCRQWIPPPNTDAAIVACTHGDPQPSAWSRKALAAFGDGGPNDLSIGDADRDGRPETYVPAMDGLYRVTAAGMTKVSTRPNWVHLAVGDGDNDGKAEVYATRWMDDFSGSELRRLSFSGTAWTDQLVYSDPGHYLSAVTLGDVDVYGGRDVFVARNGGSAQVLQATYSGAWFTNVVADFGDDGSFLDIWTFWVANLDGDSNLELAVLTGGHGYSNAWVVDHRPPAPSVPSQWFHTRLETHAGFPSGLTAGDVDGDGKNELILGRDHGGVVLFRYASSDPYGAPVYARQDVALGFAPTELFLGDGDNDGKAELYATEFGATVRQAAHRNGAWQVASIGTLPGADPVGGRVIVGDGDGDGKREVYVAAFDYDQYVGRLVQFSFGPANPQPAFDATFSGVKGNTWWVQVNVAANQPLLGVEARVNCGEVYKPLTKQSWGGWAASFQVPTGAKVTFRATSTSGATDASGGYVWPNATPTTGC